MSEKAAFPLLRSGRPLILETTELLQNPKIIALLKTNRLPLRASVKPSYYVCLKLE